VGLFDVDLLSDDELRFGREAVAKKKLERYKNSQVGKLAASVNSGDSKMVADHPLTPHQKYASYRSFFRKPPNK
jgi:hypothetical protein